MEKPRYPVSLVLYAVIIFSAVFSRIIPHAWNFAPISALAIFSAIYLPFAQAVALPLVVRFFSDAIIGFFSWPLMLAVYLSHLFGVVMGLWIKQNKTPVRVLAAPVFSALVFFLVTNFAFLYPSYPHNWTGIAEAYSNGLPFLRGTLLGDLVYTVVLVGCYEGVRYYLRSRRVRVKITA